MKLLRFFMNSGPEVPLVLICLNQLIAGICVVLILSTASHAADLAFWNSAVDRQFLVFLVFVALFILHRRLSAYQLTYAIEGIVYHTRVKLLEKLRHTELEFLERHGATPVYSVLTVNMKQLSQGAPQLTTASQNLVTMCFALLYMLWLSVPGFLVAMTTMGLVAFLRRWLQVKVSAKMRSARAEERVFFDTLRHMVNGFKEIKLNSAKNDAIFHHAEQLARNTEELSREAHSLQMEQIIFPLGMFFLSMGAVVFFLVKNDPVHSEIALNMLAAMLLVLGPFLGVLSVAPLFAQLQGSIEEIEQLERALDGATIPPIPHQVPPFDRNFRTLSLKGMSYSYRDRDDRVSFTMGPVDLEIAKGELLFIVGGNGSGKSTLLKLATGLYRPHSGVLQVDGRPVVDEQEYRRYRELFCAIFTDYYLLDHLYGIDEVDPDELNHWLAKLQIQHKTQYRQGRFTTLQLSTGQRKRLAFVMAMMEDKPIYLFDELAADQDPEFRAHFYRVLLPELRASGKTVIVVSHDDHYFDVADRVIKMRDGAIADLDGA
ncbi:MAG: cyclic peptide export ABC transporter [Candidatus Competibacterales bacterium]